MCSVKEAVFDSLFPGLECLRDPRMHPPACSGLRFRPFMFQICMFRVKMKPCHARVEEGVTPFKTVAGYGFDF